jgi:hypothetical protein
MSKKRMFEALVLVCLAVVFAVFLRAFCIARSQKAFAPCINNLRQIVSAKDQWALENSKTTNNIPTWDDIRPYLYKSQILTCPQGGTYTIGRIGVPPACSIGGREHTLPEGEGANRSDR